MLLEKTSKLDKIPLKQIINCIPPLKYRYRGSFPSDYVPTPDNDTFAIKNAQPSNMQGEYEKWCKLLSNVVFCWLFWSWKVQSPQAAFRADDAGTTTVYLQSLRFLHDICTFSPVQSPTKKLQEFRMLMWIPSKVITCSFSISLKWMCKLYNVFASFKTF